jgi:SLOG cluster4 family
MCAYFSTGSTAQLVMKPTAANAATIRRTWPLPSRRTHLIIIHDEDAMKTTRTTPIIGVFGSSDPATLGAAEAIGYQIVARGCILLTGGTGGTQDAVKDRAIVRLK